MNEDHMQILVDLTKGFKDPGDMAKQTMQLQDDDEKKDILSAALILQLYLGAKHNSNDPETKAKSLKKFENNYLIQLKKLEDNTIWKEMLEKNNT